jgi:hypothetical protein
LAALPLEELFALDEAPRPFLGFAFETALEALVLEAALFLDDLVFTPALLFEAFDTDFPLVVALPLEFLLLTGEDFDLDKADLVFLEATLVLDGLLLLTVEVFLPFEVAFDLVLAMLFMPALPFSVDLALGFLPLVAVDFLDFDTPLAFETALPFPVVLLFKADFEPALVDFRDVALVFVATLPLVVGFVFAALVFELLALDVTALRFCL